MFGSLPRSLADSHSSEMQSAVRELGATTVYDAVIASQIDMPINARELSGPARILEEVEVSIFPEQLRRAQGLGERMRKSLMWSKWQRFMRQVLRDFDLVTVVSEPEVQPLLDIEPGYDRIAVVPNGADLVRLTGHFAEPQPETVVYTGSAHLSRELRRHGVLAGRGVAQSDCGPAHGPPHHGRAPGGHARR